MKNQDLNSQAYQNEYLRKLTIVSDKTGVSVKLVGQIHVSITNGLNKEKSLDPQQIVRIFIRDLLERGEDIEKTLTENHIYCSTDVGRVVMDLCDIELLKKEESDSQEAFKGIFKSEYIQEYLKAENIKKKQDVYHLLSYGLYAVGFALVVMTYVDMISNEVGRMGWLVGMFGWLLLTFRSRIQNFIDLLKAKF